MKSTAEPSVVLPNANVIAHFWHSSIQLLIVNIIYKRDANLKSFYPPTLAFGNYHALIFFLIEYPAFGRESAKTKCYYAKGICFPERPNQE
jgi:hypothetical protein